jgi:hypothetical protein
MRVLVLLIVLLLMEASVSPSLKSLMTAQTKPDIKTVFYYGVAFLALMALAAPLPDVATALVVLLIMAVLLNHSQQFKDMFTPKKG